MLDRLTRLGSAPASPPPAAVSGAITTRASGAANRSREVDALRCLAMFAVFALHAHLMPFGWIGVWLFYAISGYVVTLSILADEPANRGTRRLSRFMRRRVARIVPVYYAFILIGLIVGALQGLPQDRLSIAGLFGFFDNILIVAGGGRVNGWPSSHLWTLSVEMQFYAVYGAAICLLPRRMTVALLVAVVLVCPPARLATAQWLVARDVPPLDAAFAIYVGPGLHFDTFAMGCLLAFAKQRGRLGDIARPLFLAGVAALAAYALAYWSVNQSVRGETGIAAVRNILSGILFGEHREVFLYSAVGLAMTGLVAVAATGDCLIRPLLGLPALQRIGAISYGGYLFHAPALRASAFLLRNSGIDADGAIANLIQFAIACAIALPLAALVYRWFEKPVQRWLTAPPHLRHTVAPSLSATV